MCWTGRICHLYRRSLTFATNFKLGYSSTILSKYKKFYLTSWNNFNPKDLIRIIRIMNNMKKLQKKVWKNLLFQYDVFRNHNNINLARKPILYSKWGGCKTKLCPKLLDQYFIIELYWILPNKAVRGGEWNNKRETLKSRDKLS